MFYDKNFKMLNDNGFSFLKNWQKLALFIVIIALVHLLKAVILMGMQTSSVSVTFYTVIIGAILAGFMLLSYKKTLLITPIDISIERQFFGFKVVHFDWKTTDIRYLSGLFKRIVLQSNTQKYTLYPFFWGNTAKKSLVATIQTLDKNFQ